MNNGYTYESTSGDIAGFNIIEFPSSSNGEEMLKVDNTDAKIANSDRLAMNMPGQILWILFISLWRHRCGLPAAISKGCNTIPDIWIQFGILQEPFRPKLFRLQVYVRIV